MEKDEYKIMNEIEDYHWWFTGKGILIKNVCNWIFHSPRNDRRILDLGCGTGAILKKLEEYGDPYGIEVAPEAIACLRNKNISNIILSDANQSIPLKDNTFSLITCLDALEHIDNDTDLIHEMLRVCIQGGYLVITVPAFNILWSYHDEALHHKRRYTKKQLMMKLDRSDCRIIKASYYNFCLFIPILVFRRLKEIFSGQRKEIHSDCSISMPTPVNELFSLLFRIEIWCLRFLNFPFGVSLLLIFQKTEK